MPVTSRNLKRDIHNTYQPFGASRKIWSARNPDILAVGPARTGKSRGLLEKGHYCATQYDGARILCVRKTRGSMSESVLQIYEDQVLPKGDRLLNGAKRSIRQEYIYPNGSRLIPAGMDNPEKVLSSEYDMILCFEGLELTQNDYEVLSTRLSNQIMPYRQIIIDCNPGSPTHWIRRRMLKGDFKVFESVHKDNPVLYDHKLDQWTPAGIEYIGRLKRLTGVRYDRLYKGLWVASEGAVYNFTDRHLLKRSDMPEGWEKWRKIRTIDFGYTKPFVCQWWAIDPDGRMYCYREIYMSHRLVRAHAQLIVTLSAGESFEVTVADWDAEGRADLEANGVSTVPAYKAIESGKEAVEDRMTIAGDGKPRIFFLEDALVETDMLMEELKHPVQTTQEFDLYIYKPARASSAVNNSKPDKEEPIDEYNHGMDAMRYAVAYVDRVGVGEVRLTMEDTEVVERPGSLAASTNTVTAIPEDEDFCVFV